MRPFALNPGDIAPPPLGAPARGAVIALVEGGEFAGAQAAIPSLAGYFDYDDWLDRQEGLQIGLAMAGFETTLVRVDLASFLEWRRLTGAHPDESALDAFAAVTLAMRTASIAKVMAMIGRSDFVRHAAALVAIAAGRDYERWSRHRRAAQVKIEALGGRVVRLPVGVEAFLAWCACLGQVASEDALDRYAQLTLERLTTPVTR